MFEPWGLELPSDAEIRAEGSVPNKQGWYIRYRFGRGGERELMDTFACHRMTNDGSTGFMRTDVRNCWGRVRICSRARLREGFTRRSSAAR